MLLPGTELVEHKGEQSKVLVSDRRAAFGNDATILWITGGDDQQRSELGVQLEKALFNCGIPTVLIDRYDHRYPNIANATQASSLASRMVDAGLCVVCTVQSSEFSSAIKDISDRALELVDVSNINNGQVESFAANIAAQLR